METFLVPCLHKRFLLRQMTLPTLTLQPVQSPLKIGDQPGDIPPNIHESCILADVDGTPVGMFLKTLPDDLQNLVNIADAEIHTDRVPKSTMKRSSGLHNDSADVLQYSTILGSIPPKPHMRRAYPSKSSVHANRKANTFVKVMNAAGIMAFDLMSRHIPSVAATHLMACDNRLPTKWRFAQNFSSTISNCNISAPVHQDNANVKRAINLIITKRQNSTGGNLHVPDFDATFDQTDNSLLVYPAWRNRHGVTPIVPTHQGGYRNSHVWYALDSFANHG